MTGSSSAVATGASNGDLAPAIDLDGAPAPDQPVAESLNGSANGNGSAAPSTPTVATDDDEPLAEWELSLDDRGDAESPPAVSAAETSMQQSDVAADGAAAGTAEQQPPTGQPQVIPG